MCNGLRQIPVVWKAALAANTRERRNGRRVVDCGGKGRVATDIAGYSTVYIGSKTNMT